MRNDWYRAGRRVLARKAVTGRDKREGRDATVPEGSRGTILAVLAHPLLECEFTWENQTVVAIIEQADVAPDEPIGD